MQDSPPIANTQGSMDWPWLGLGSSSSRYEGTKRMLFEVVYYRHTGHGRSGISDRGGLIADRLSVSLKLFLILICLRFGLRRRPRLFTLLDVPRDL